MLLIWIGILFIFSKISYIKGSEEALCRNSNKCRCINVISPGALEFQCPPASYEEIKIKIHLFRTSKRMRIDCIHLEALNDTFLPEGNFSMVKKLEFQNCPFPEKGFKYIVDKFSLHHLEFLRFAEHDVNKILTSEDLEELYNVKTLELESNNISKLNSNIFENSPELVDLMINNNELILSENIFAKTPKLLTLSISSNNIDNIPKGTFRSLNELQTLSLWQNNLIILNKGIFDSLVNLKMLELSHNKIEVIEEGVFDFTKNLLNLTLSGNKIVNISRRIFENCPVIELIKLNLNPDMNLVDDVFSNFSNLKYIELAYNELESIPENLFRGSMSLHEVTLNDNRLRTLPTKIFESMKSLQELHLENNQIESLHPEIFTSLENLQNLYVQNNQLENIDGDLLIYLKNLKKIDLSFNKIKTLPTQCLRGNINLEIFIMSHNQFNFEDSEYIGGNTPFSSISSTNLKKVDLSFNNITRYPYQLNRIATIEHIELRHNNIQEIMVNLLSTINANPVTVDLTSNNISNIKISDLNQRFSFRVNIEISNNPILCDCNALNITRYVQENDHPIRNNLVLNYDRIECAGPKKFIGLSLKEVNLNELICFLGRDCTSNESCDCMYRSSNNSLVVDCARRKLRDIPELKNMSAFIDVNQIEVHLEDNFLERCPSELDGYENTSSWYLKGNFIRNITWIPSSLRVLDLRENQIEKIDTNSLMMLNESKLDNLLLGRNPWKCTCEEKNFLAYLREHLIQIDVSSIRCNTTRNRLIDLSDKDLCVVETDVYLVITVVTLTCLFVLTSGLSLYFLYREEILIWLYGRGFCLWLVEEEELDMQKVYDAFISFSHKDEDFVIENLVSVLEDGMEPYRLCIHFRDWIPGELIQTQIRRSVGDSRRTIVILSANFLESVWGIVEFKTAHNEAMREGRARVIIIIYGDLNIETLDDDLKVYLRTNTYIKWGDPWFWDKLKYALPKRTGRQVISTKHANMMQYIEDKFKLSSQSSNNISSPTILNPHSLEEKPLACLL